MVLVQGEMRVLIAFCVRPVRQRGEQTEKKEQAEHHFRQRFEWDASVFCVLRIVAYLMFTLLV